ncbi:hypothetical protein FocnCong_v001400 [Fusarium oxysporum f. sp. conglutinans]|nr:hypothetical protein FocnCong_v001400 [Fusarium oxysporum f. sp. conglutinans]
MAEVYHALNGGGLTGSPPDPAITELPKPYNRDILKRQNLGTYDVCGYYSIPGQFWVVNYCYYSGVSTTTCATSSSHIGCDGYVKTRCFTSSSCTSTSSNELCCPSGCITAISTDSDGDELTLYPFCTTKHMEVTMYKELKGVSASMETSLESNSESTSSDGQLTAKTGTTGESKTQEAASYAESSSSSGPDTSSNSSATVGAIVGGVLGGLAFLALIGFGLWFIRHKKRQGGNGTHVVQQQISPQSSPTISNSPSPTPKARRTTSLWRRACRLRQRRTHLLLTCEVRLSMKFNLPTMIARIQLNIAERGIKRWQKCTTT